MQAIRDITYDGVKLSTYGAYCISGTTAGTPTRDITETTIPGRHGSLITDNKRFNNRSFTLTFGIKSESGIYAKVDSFAAYMAAHGSGYSVLVDPQMAGTYLLARVSDTITPTVYRGRTTGAAAIISVPMSAKPQRYYDAGKVSSTLSAGTLNNPTLFPAYPILSITGTGTLTIGSQTLTVSSNPGTITLHCETMDAYSGSTNCNSSISYTGQLVVQPGNNTVTVSGLTVTITPRWYTL